MGFSRGGSLYKREERRGCQVHVIVNRTATTCPSGARPPHTTGNVSSHSQIWERHSYDSVRHMKPSMAGAELQLTCDVIHEKCPTFKYGNEGPDQQCVFDDVPDVLDNVLHHAIPPDGPGLREVTYGSQKLVVENTCFYAGNRARIDDERDVKRGKCKYAGSWREYLEKLGVAGRDTAKHPWGE